MLSNRFIRTFMACFIGLWVTQCDNSSDNITTREGNSFVGDTSAVRQESQKDSDKLSLDIPGVKLLLDDKGRVVVADGFAVPLSTERNKNGTFIIPIAKLTASMQEPIFQYSLPSQYEVSFSEPVKVEQSLSLALTGNEKVQQNAIKECEKQDFYNEVPTYSKLKGDMLTFKVCIKLVDDAKEYHFPTPLITIDQNTVAGNRSAHETEKPYDLAKEQPPEDQINLETASDPNACSKPSVTEAKTYTDSNNALISTWPASDGTLVKVKCSSGYTYEGSDLTCNKGSWEGQGSCVEGCLLPSDGQIAHSAGFSVEGDHSNGIALSGASITPKCKEGFLYSDENAKKTCTDGKWTGSYAKCKGICTFDLDDDPNIGYKHPDGSVLSKGMTIDVGTKASGFCKDPSKTSYAFSFTCDATESHSLAGTPDCSIDAQGDPCDTSAIAAALGDDMILSEVSQSTVDGSTEILHSNLLSLKCKEGHSPEKNLQLADLQCIKGELSLSQDLAHKCIKSCKWPPDGFATENTKGIAGFTEHWYVDQERIINCADNNSTGMTDIATTSDLNEYHQLKVKCNQSKGDDDKFWSLESESKGCFENCTYADETHQGDGYTTNYGSGSWAQMVSHGHEVPIHCAFSGVTAPAGATLKCNDGQLSSTNDFKCKKKSSELNCGVGEARYPYGDCVALDQLPACAAEGGVCNTFNSQFPFGIKYGNEGQAWAVRYIKSAQDIPAGGFKCEAASFGGLDPLPGVAKVCKLFYAAQDFDEWFVCPTGVTCAPKEGQQFHYIYGVNGSPNPRYLYSKSATSCAVANPKNVNPSDSTSQIGECRYLGLGAIPDSETLHESFKRTQQEAFALLNDFLKKAEESFEVTFEDYNREPFEKNCGSGDLLSLEKDGTKKEGCFPKCKDGYKPIASVDGITGNNGTCIRDVACPAGSRNEGTDCIWGGYTRLPYMAKCMDGWKGLKPTGFIVETLTSLGVEKSKLEFLNKDLVCFKDCPSGAYEPPIHGARDVLCMHFGGVPVPKQISLPTACQKNHIRDVVTSLCMEKCHPDTHDIPGLRPFCSESEPHISRECPAGTTEDGGYTGKCVRDAYSRWDQYTGEKSCLGHTEINGQCYIKCKDRYDEEGTWCRVKEGMETGSQLDKLEDDFSTFDDFKLPTIGGGN